MPPKRVNEDSLEDSSAKMLRVSRTAKVFVQQTVRNSGFTLKTTASASRENKRRRISSDSSEARSDLQPDPLQHGSSDAMMHSLEQDTIEEAWYAALEPEFSKPYFRKLKQFLAAEMKSHTIYPAAADIYSWSRLTPLDQVKVVILGQDPYHDVNQAHGLAFSVLPPTKPPPSLRNIYKQLAADIPGFIPPAFGDLSPLARAGVLFLNTSLSVRAHKAASHSGRGWEEFTQAALRAVLARKTIIFDAASPGEAGAGRVSDEPPSSSSRRAGDKGVVFMAWGLHAQKTCASVGIDETKHLVLKSAHPSPLSARRGFLGNGHFATANEWLKERYGEYGVVDWRVLSEKR